ncbi:MAG TPA: DNA integrity scanning protein DisA nucleotide-binding domain protein [Pyrinomonadaceae bacterium]|nr:DNA integrity scanning protein DisA nucleotide-binding domain protein [Pyrinomonadaceae bacterium]
MNVDLTSERRKLIALELGALGICAQDQFNLFETLVDACYRVMTAIPHENRLPSTGVVLFSHSFDQYDFEEGGQFIRVKPSEEEVCWSFADGIHSFVAKDPEGVGLLVLKAPALDELSLFTFRDDILFDDEVGPSDPPRRECLVIQRSEGHSTRRVTILARESIVNFSGLAYVSKPYQYDILQALRKTIDPFPWGDDCVQTLKSALRLAVHKLSPENHGATFVILAPNDISALGDLNAARHLIVDQAICPPNCSLVKRAYQRPLVHLMGQMDGATTISPRGDVVNVGAFFRSVGENTAREGATHYGTRHRSAAQFSREIEGIAIVISSDGPVTVFRKGEALPIPKIDN